MNEKEIEYEAEVGHALQTLIEKIGKTDVIEDYKKIAEKVNEHQGLKNLVEEIKRHQKDAVQFAHYDKPEAEREAIRLANEKQRAFDEHPLVIVYREKLIEANDLLQHVTNLVERNVNQSLEDKLNQTEESEN